MALDTNELFESVDRASFPRIIPASTGGVYPKTFGPTVGLLLLTVGDPVAFDATAGKWVLWDSAGGGAGADTIIGFIYPNDVQTDDVNDVLGNVMVKGMIHLDDIGIPAGENLAGLKTALRSGPLARGLIVQGLEDVR